MSTQILRETLETILAADDTFPARFYEILFQRHPELRPLFKSSSPNVQRLKFAQTLAWIVDHYDEPDALQRELSKLALAHKGFGVTDEMYPMVGDALLDTFREALGAGFTPDVEALWRDAFDRISRAMRAAASAS